MSNEVLCPFNCGFSFGKREFDSYFREEVKYHVDKYCSRKKDYKNRFILCFHGNRQINIEKSGDVKCSNCLEKEKDTFDKINTTMNMYKDNSMAIDKTFLGYSNVNQSFFKGNMSIMDPIAEEKDIKNKNPKKLLKPNYSKEFKEFNIDSSNENSKDENNEPKNKNKEEKLENESDEIDYIY